MNSSEQRHFESPLQQARVTSVKRVREVSDLCALFEPSTNVVVFSRRLDDELTQEAELLLSQPGFQLLTTVSPGCSQSALDAQLPAFSALARELHFWSEVLGELTDCERVGIRLASVTSALCPRFHVDKVTVRVVCALVGPGVEFLANEDVERRWLGHAANGKKDEVSGLLLPGARIHRSATGDVVLLKGESWPAADCSNVLGAVHRSPAASSAAARLVMTLDPL